MNARTKTNSSNNRLINDQPVSKLTDEAKSRVERKMENGSKNKLESKLKNKIRSKEQIIARLERNLALEKIKQRKAETRRKIEFGGLVVKASMDKYSKAIILGALLDAAETLNREKAGAKMLYQSKGEAAFMEY